MPKGRFDKLARLCGEDMMDASIIVPFYNAEKSISACITSLLCQKTSRSYEIIAVDDGSKDEGFKVVEELAKKAKVNVVLLRQKNKGPSAARNLGAKSAKGDILVFIDSDCEASESWLEEMLSPFEDKEVLACQGAYKTRQKEFMARFVQLEIEERYERMKRIGKIDWVGSYSAAYRKNIFIEVGGFDEGFTKASGEDPDLAYKVSRKGKIAFAEKAIVYHKHPTSIIDYLKKKYVHAFYRIRLYSKHKDKAIRDSYTPQSLKLQIIFSVLFVLISLISTMMACAASLALFSFILFLASTAKSSLFNIKKDVLAGIMTPSILFFRSIAFALGLSLGMLNKVFG